MSLGQAIVFCILSPWLIGYLVVVIRDIIKAVIKEESILNAFKLPFDDE